MSKVVKGLPASFGIFVKDDDTYINLNDGDWEVDVSLRYQTKEGPEPFPISATPTGNGFLIELTPEETATLNHRGSGYIIVVKANTLDNLTNLRSTIRVNVVDDL